MKPPSQMLTQSGSTVATQECRRTITHRDGSRRPAPKYRAGCHALAGVGMRCELDVVRTECFARKLSDLDLVSRMSHGSLVQIRHDPAEIEVCLYADGMIM